MLVAAVIFASAIGSERINFFALSTEQRAILFDIRLPRVLLAAGVGASLAAAGAALQAMLRNPLAEPGALLRVRRSARRPDAHPGLTPVA